MIYFMQAVDGGPIKIGFSDNVDARRKHLEFTYKRPLAILATSEGNRSTERTIHEKFSHLRLGRTEQFRPAPELMAFIGRPLLVSPNPDSVEAMPDDRKPMVLQMRGSAEWKEWAEKVARKDGSTLAALADRAIRRYAKELGFDDPPPR